VFIEMLTRGSAFRPTTAAGDRYAFLTRIRCALPVSSHIPLASGGLDADGDGVLIPLVQSRKNSRSHHSPPSIHLGRWCCWSRNTAHTGSLDR